MDRAKQDFDNERHVKDRQKICNLLRQDSELNKVTQQQMAVIDANTKGKNDEEESQKNLSQMSLDFSAESDGAN